MLPPALALRAQVERALDAVWGLSSEAEVRARLRDINDEIGRANRTSADGPLTSLAPLEPDAIVARWRERRPTA